MEYLLINNSIHDTSAYSTFSLMFFNLNKLYCKLTMCLFLSIYYFTLILITFKQNSTLDHTKYKFNDKCKH